jgi:hypothetical protein
MFTIEEINDLHARLGSTRTLAEYVRALMARPIRACDRRNVLPARIRRGRMR